MTKLAPTLALTLSLSASACGGPPFPEAPEAPRIASVHRARCGQCHKRVEPGERSRSVLEDALGRHRKRVRMAEGDWALMVDYLAGPKEIH